MAAGLGFKTFTTGEVLTAADTNGYLMQGVLVFASAAARDAAITSPQEGQCCYLKDTDAVLTYSGAAWVGFDDTNAIQNTIVDAKGDLIGATAADTPARLAVGTNGQVLTADSTAATGLAWATASSGSSYVAGKNLVINGGFDVWQRGTSFASGTRAYTADRFEFFRQGSAAGATLTRQSSGLTTTQYCARVSRDSGNTATNILWLTNSIETANAIPYQGKTIAFSFYARAGANFSATSSILNFSVQSGTGTDQNLNAGYTGSADVIASTNATLTTSWQRFTYTGTVASSATELGFYFDYAPTGTAGAADYYEITGIQLEAASSATTFSRNASNIQGELAACQRYYWRSSQGGTYGVHCQGFGISATQAYVTLPMPVTMRTSGGTLEYSTLNLNDSQSNWAVTALTINAVFSTANAQTLVATIASGLALYRPVMLLNNNSSAGYVGYSAEL
jgi:hypothetical protein